jgi:hypothetical protein
LWAGLQGYQVWVTTRDGAACMAPLDFMQDGFGLCLDTGAAMGCPGIYGGFAPGPVCEQVGFWTCVGLFRADYGYDYLMEVR